jgi:hypothetical protein
MNFSNFRNFPSLTPDSQSPLNMDPQMLAQLDDDFYLQDSLRSPQSTSPSLDNKYFYHMSLPIPLNPFTNNDINMSQSMHTKQDDTTRITYLTNSLKRTPNRRKKTQKTRIT